MTDSNTDSSPRSVRHIAYDLSPDGIVITFPDGTTNALFSESDLLPIGCASVPATSDSFNCGAIHATPDGRITQAVNPAPAVPIPSECITSGVLTTSHTTAPVYTWPIWEGYVPHEPPEPEISDEQWEAYLKSIIPQGALEEWWHSLDDKAKPQTAPEELQDSPELSAFLDSFRQKGGAADGK